MAAPSPHVLGIEPKMYRHFTALTLVISLTIAFFANGDQRQTLAHEGKVKPEKVEKKPKGQRSEMDVLNGVSEDPSPVKAGNSAPPPPPSVDEGPISPDAADDGQFSSKGSRFTYRRPPLRADPALLARMNPEQRAGYLKALALREQQQQLNQGGSGGSPAGPSGGNQSGPSQQQINRLVAASRARSGSGD